MSEKVLNNLKKVKEQRISYNYYGKVYEDAINVSYFSYENYLNKLQNALIGDLDKEGNYKITEEVLKKLTSLKKVIVKKENDILYLKSESSVKTFNFIVKTGQAGKNKLYAQLVLNENLSSIALQNEKLSTHVVYYTDTADAFFEAKYKKAFNVVLSADGGKEENDKILGPILDNIKYNGKIYQRYLVEGKLKDKIYLEKLLKQLTNDKNGAKLLTKYNNLLNEHKASLDPKNKDYYRNLKQLLDMVIEENPNAISRETKDYINNIRNVYVKANTMTIDGIVQKEKKENIKIKEENIKMGKGAGLPSLGNYSPPKGNDKKKNSSKYTSVTDYLKTPAKTSFTNVSSKVKESVGGLDNKKISFQDILLMQRKEYIEAFELSDTSKKNKTKVSNENVETKELKNEKNGIEILPS